MYTHSYHHFGEGTEIRVDPAGEPDDGSVVMTLGDTAIFLFPKDFARLHDAIVEFQRGRANPVEQLDRYIDEVAGPPVAKVSKP